MKPSTRRTAQENRDSRPPRHERTPPPTEEEKAFVEQVGIFFEEMGVPRMAGRIVGRLLIADPPEQSSAQLMRSLQASKGSISTMTRMLIQLGLVERVGMPGERIDHFRVRDEGWGQLTLGRALHTSRMRTLLEEALTLPSARRPAVRRRIEDVRDFYAFFEREMPALLERYERERERRPPKARPRPKRGT